MNRPYCWIAAACACFFTPVFGQVPIGGPNVNMVSGTQWPGGDPFLQRQNEPSIAVSTRNPAHLLAGANDYRTVDLSILFNTTSVDPDAKVTGDAWLGVFKSFDGGQRWKSNLLPGCKYGPQAGCSGPAGAPSSPVAPLAYDAGADPVVRAGPNGTFFYSGIAFDRNHGRSAVFLSRFIDDNNNEGFAKVPSTDPNDPQGTFKLVPNDTIRYLDQTIVDADASGQFIDKPWLAVDIPRAGGGTCPIAGYGQPIPAFNVYVAYARFTGTNNSAQIYVAVSRDCGITWNKAVKVSPGTSKPQGSVLAIDPTTGYVYLGWRQFQLDTTQPDAIKVVKSTDGGNTFSKPVVVSNIIPFDLSTTSGNSGTGIRTLSFPSTAVDENGRVYVTWAARQTINGDARVMLSTSTDGATWSTPQMVEPPPPLYDYFSRLLQPGLGHQFMPSINIANGRVAIVYYSLYEDATVGELLCPVGFVGLCDRISKRLEFRMPNMLGNLNPAPPSNTQLGVVFGPGLVDGAGLTRRHTLDARVAMASTGASPSFTVARLSQYLYGSSDSGSLDPSIGSNAIRQLRFNTPNLPLFAQGTQPFMGDYVDVAAQTIIPGSTAGTWTYNTSTVVKPQWHATWTDNRDVRPPADGNWTNYTPTIQPPVGPASGPCVVGQAGMRDQNVYTARVSEGLLVSVPGNSKFLSNNVPKRAYSVVVQNNTSLVKSYRLTVANQPANGSASFQQTGPLVASVDASAAPLSSFSRVVFVTSTTSTYPQIAISVQEITAPGGTVVSGGQATSVALNPDLTNPDLTNPDLTNPDLTNTSIQTAEIYVPDLTNPDLTNPDLTNPDLTNPDLTNPDLTNPDLTNPDLTNPDLTNPATAAPDLTNPDLTNPDLTNPDLTNPDLTNVTLTDFTTTVTNQGNTTSTFKIRLVTPNPAQIPNTYKFQLLLTKIYPTAQLSKTSCTVIESRQTVMVANIPLSLSQNNVLFVSPQSPDLTNPDLTNPDLTNATLTLAPGEQGFVTLRVQAPRGVSQQQVDQFINSTFQTVAVAGAVNTNLPAGSPPASALAITTLTLPAAVQGTLYNAPIQTIGGTAPLTFSVTMGALPAGLGVNASTGAISGTPTAAGAYNFTIGAVDSGSPQQSASRAYTVVVAGPLAITTVSVPNPFTQTAYNSTVVTSGGTAPLAFTIASGAFPPGLDMDPNTGLIFGPPGAIGTFNFSIKVTDSSIPQQSVTHAYSVTVSGFLPTGSLNAGRNAQTATVLTNGKVLMAGGNTNGFTVASSEIYDPTTGTFTVASSMAIPRYFHTATLLNNGKVLVVGGLNGGPGLASAEIYDPSSGTFAPTGSLNVGRYAHTATLLPSGKVLVAGGATTSGGTVVSSAEIYDPSTGAFTLTANTMSSVRSYFTATSLNNGKVLLSGGTNGVVSFNSADLYDPSTNLFTATGSMNHFRDFHTATLLNTGKVLITGGENSADTTTGDNGQQSVGWNEGELYDPSTGLFTEIPSTMSTKRWGHTATLLTNGTVLVAGTNATFVPSDIYDPVSNTFTFAGNLGNQEVLSTPAVLLTSGTVLIAGGAGAPTIGEIYTPVSFTPPGLTGIAVTPVNPMIAAGAGVRFTATGTFISGPPQVLASVIWSSSNPAVAAITNDQTNRGEAIASAFGSPTITATAGAVSGSTSATATGFGPTGSMTIPRGGHTTTLLTNGKALVTGGLSSGGVTNTAELYDPNATTFSATGSMNSPRLGSTATLLQNGKVLVTGGVLNASTYPTTGTAELYDPATGIFLLTGSMSITRAYHSATLLPSGKVLIAGGCIATCGSGGVFTASAELYDPATGVFTPAGNMTDARELPNAVLLYTGKVLIAGGVDNSSPVFTAELYDPTTGTFTATGATMTAAHYRGTATLLNNGKVLIAGGDNAIPSAVAEIYDPTAGTFTATGSMAQARELAAATLLTNGQVLITGGANSNNLASAELYDPSSGMFSPGGTMTVARSSHTATLLANGMVLIAGSANVVTSTAELYSPATLTPAGLVSIAITPNPVSPSVATVQKFTATGTFSSGPPQTLASVIWISSNTASGAAITADAGDKGSALFTGTNSVTLRASAGISQALVVGANGRTFNNGPALSAPRTLHTATLLPNGKVLLAGGTTTDGLSNAISSTDLYDPSTGTVVPGPSMNTARYSHTATLLNNGKVLIAGGYTSDFSVAIATAEIYDPIANTFTPTPTNLTVGRGQHTATLLTDGTVLIAGGSGSGAPFSNPVGGVEIYNPVTGIFSITAGAMTSARLGHTATLLGNGMVLIAGGNPLAPLGNAEIYNPATQAFASVGSMLAPRALHTATLLANGQVLLIGGVTAGGSGTSIAELYDPAAGTFIFNGNLPGARYSHQATPLFDGTILITAGYQGQFNSGCPCTSYADGQVYNPANSSFNLVSNSLTNGFHYAGTATLLDNGLVFVAGGGASQGGTTGTDLY